jgi:hydroxyacylglutathione hydrolase
VLHAPGHTEGSVMFGIDAVPPGMPEGLDRTMLTGDVLFAGSIGRTDLHGGSAEAMSAPCARWCFPCPIPLSCCPATVRRPR